MIPPPPRSTLFPYTTLFRSYPSNPTDWIIGIAVPVDLRANLVDVAAAGAGQVLRLRRKADRKSTRLNSSHGYISYAVFCLKKKKKKTCRFQIEERITYVQTH